jgi:hypothetical protein
MPDVGLNLIGLRHSSCDSVLRPVFGLAEAASLRDFHSLRVNWVTLATGSARKALLKEIY